jgi:predicted nuclease of predicted toxin-antitoxin system
VKFLLDENLSPRHAATIRSWGHDATSVVESGLGGKDDFAIRGAAVESGRILVTLDGDFANVLRFPPQGTPGVMRMRLHPPTEEAIENALQFAIARLTDISLDGKLVIVDEKKIRIRG